MGYQIAIDGPAGAGKSTIAKLLAKKKGFVYVDTGAMYRGLAYYFLSRGIQPQEEAAIAKACNDVSIDIAYENGIQQIYVNHVNVTCHLREEAVGNMASRSSGIAVVRAKLLELQRDLAEKENVVMDGRDIGTSVLPDADLKIFLTASVDTRARRRYNELLEAQGEESRVRVGAIARFVFSSGAAALLGPGPFNRLGVRVVVLERHLRAR